MFVRLICLFSNISAGLKSLNILFVFSVNISRPDFVLWVRLPNDQVESETARRLPQGEGT